MHRNQILIGDVRDMLATLPDESVHCVVTSPPYWGLRDYGTATWEGGDAECNHKQGRNGSGRADGIVDERGQRNRDGAGAMGGDCGKCGARRIDSQLGLEATPEEYVANMVAVFRDVRRVLRADGTLWLNLGDSYAADGRGTGGSRVETSAKQRTSKGSYFADAVRTQHGLKPKDLVGIPWRLAFALQQPYYTGSIKDEKDRIWLAAMIDGEGCMFIHKRKIGQNNGQGYARKSDTYGSGLEVANTSEAIVRRCMEITGRGSIVRQEKDRRQPLYRWNLRSNECRDVIREVYPYLVGKQHQARLLIACPSSGKDAERAHLGMMALHNGEPCDIDFPAPAPLYEPGFYLRSDVIWSKSNPMPESVTDRPTKAHEYVFLLSKSAKYWYDAEAIKEKVGELVRMAASFRDGGVYTNNRSFDNDGAADKATHGDGDLSLAGRNKRTVWEIATQPYAEAHFATFPEALVKPCILAGTSEQGCCAECGAPWERVVERVSTGKSYAVGKSADKRAAGLVTGFSGYDNGSSAPVFRTTGWAPTCKHDAPTVPGIVLDPFLGSGTTALVALKAGRDFVGIELNPDYAAMAEQRIAPYKARLL